MFIIKSSGMSAGPVLCSSNLLAVCAGDRDELQLHLLRGEDQHRAARYPPAESQEGATEHTLNTPTL